MDKKKIILLCFLGLVLLGIIFIPGYLRIKRLDRERRELEMQIRRIKETNIRLKEELVKMKSDPIYLEKVAREKLGVAKKGEIVYKVLPEKEE